MDKKQTRLTREQHHQVIKELENGATKAELMAKFKISQTNYYRLLNNYSEKNFPNPKRRRIARSSINQLKIAVWEWMRTACQTNPKLIPQQSLVRKKATELASLIGCSDYYVSESWAKNTRRAFRDSLNKEMNVQKKDAELNGDTMLVELITADSSIPSKQETLEAFDTIRQALQGSDHVPTSVFGFLDMLQTFYAKDVAFKCHEKLTSAKDS